MLRAVVILAMGLLVSGAAAAQTKRAYVCLENQNNGFSSKSGSYSYAKFKENKFTMLFDGSVARTKEDGHEEVYDCSVPFKSRPNIYQCVTTFNVLVFNADNGKFTKSFLYGYVAGENDSLNISYGDCQDF